MSGVLLFDLDGTLTDADHLHFEAWRTKLRDHGVDIDLDRYKAEFMGFPNADIMRNVLPAMPLAEAEALAEAKEVLFRELATELEPMPGLHDFLNWADGRGTRYGVVTNAPRLNAAQQLAGIGLGTRFETLVIGYELDFPKPHPLPYLTGLEKLGGTAAQSLAFEDSRSGIRAALAAGLAVVGITTGLSAARLMEEGVALAVADFTDPRLRPFVEQHLAGQPAAA